jgi:hypothetical protein
MKRSGLHAPTLPDPLQAQIEAVIESWYGIGLPNEASYRFITGLAGTAPVFAAARARLSFEDEPASFEAALLETKEPM